MPVNYGLFENPLTDEYDKKRHRVDVAAKVGRGIRKAVQEDPKIFGQAAKLQQARTKAWRIRSIWIPSSIENRLGREGRLRVSAAEAIWLWRKHARGRRSGHPVTPSPGLLVVPHCFASLHIRLAGPGRSRLYWSRSGGCIGHLMTARMRELRGNRGGSPVFGSPSWAAEVQDLRQPQVLAIILLLLNRSLAR